MKSYTSYLILLVFPLFLSCEKHAPLETVKTLEIEKYMGTWYEIARLPNRFETDLSCVTANYTLLENGKVEVRNNGLKTDKEEWTDIKGSAWRPNDSKQGQLKVQFFWPFAGDYYVIGLGQNYEWALVGDPSRKFLWILSRNELMEEKAIQELLALASYKGFDVSLVERVPQGCDD